MTKLHSGSELTDASASADPRVRFGTKLILWISLSHAAFVAVLLLSGEAGDAWPQVLGVVIAQTLLSLGLGVGVSNAKYFPIVHPIIGSVNYAAGLYMIFVCGGYPTLFWMTSMFAVFPSAFFAGRLGATINAAVALVGLLVPHGDSITTPILVGSGSQVLTLVVLGLVAVSLFRLVSDAEGDHLRAAIQLESANAGLLEAVAQRDVEAQKKVVLNEMSDLVQSSADSDEAFSILASYGRRLFPEHCGAFFVYRNSRDYLELAANWGEMPAEHLRAFTSDECWALRRARPYLTKGAPNDIVCHHIQDGARGWAESLCVPMMAQGEILGVFHLVLAQRGQSGETTDETLALTVALDGALGLSNLRLRETLRNQALRDPVTQLYNRRYLDEALPREIHRAERRGQPLAVAMLDIDHFKMFNDTYGHDAGDVVLREVGALLRSNTRVEDLACRYGGEEFAIVFVETSLEQAIQRAEALRMSLSALSVEHQGKRLGKVTVSLGVAAMPQNRGEELLKMADTMLYRAKNEGRDRVVSAD